MKLKNNAPKVNHMTASVHPTGESDLISSVYHLVDCVHRMAPGTNTPEGCHYHDAGQTAFAAALTAERRIADLMERVAILETTSRSDELTGLLNRRGFLFELNRALAAAKRYDETGMLVYVDLDGFKDINDSFGHPAGDAALCYVARILEENVRATDYVARLGGDEFAVLLTHASREQALGRAEILDQILNTAHVSWESRNIPLAASVGVYAYDQTSTPDDLVRMADEAMYKTKKMRDTHLNNQKRA